MKIKYIVNAVKWWDKVNGNTYHSVRVTRCEDGKQLVGEMQYGYGDHYCQTALEIMNQAGWLPEKYKNEPFMYERENDYPISWNVRDGKKRECIDNGIL